MKIILFSTLLSASLSASLLDFKYLEEAKDAYNNKNYSKAQTLYQKVDQDEARFNVADALYRQKKYKEAIEAYEQIEEPTLEAKKLHNIGNSYAQLKKIDEAIEAYTKALKLSDDADTQFNLDLLKKKKEEQKKKDKKKKDDKKKDKDKKDKKKDSDKKQKDKDQQKKDDDKKKKEQEEKKKKEEQQKKDEKKKKEEEKKKKNPQMQDQNKTQPPISNMEERKWQKMLNKRGVQTLMIPLNKGDKNNEENPW